MKICNSCMQMTGDTADVCPVCKMHDFTSLDSKQASRERQVKRLKKSKGVYRQPRRNVRKVSYRLGSRGRNNLLQSVGTFVLGSLVLSVILNSTIWSAPGNPLDATNYAAWFTGNNQDSSGFVLEWLSATAWENNESNYSYQVDSSYFSNEPYDSGRLYLNLEATNNSGEYQDAVNISTMLLGSRLFDADDWELEGCVPKSRSDFGLLMDGETQQVTLCFEAAEPSDYKLMFGSQTLFIDQGEVSFGAVPFSPNDVPDTKLPGVGETVTSHPYSVVINTASREGNYLAVDTTYSNLSAKTLPIPQIQVLFEDGSRTDRFEWNHSTDKGDAYDIPPQSSVRLQRSIRLPAGNLVEIRFFNLNYQDQTWQPLVKEIAAFTLQ